MSTDTNEARQAARNESVFARLAFRDPKVAFSDAIASGRLSRVESAANFAGSYMYMGTDQGVDLFKHIATREYLASGRPPIDVMRQFLATAAAKLGAWFRLTRDRSAAPTVVEPARTSVQREQHTEQSSERKSVEKQAIEDQQAKLAGARASATRPTAHVAVEEKAATAVRGHVPIESKGASNAPAISAKTSTRRR